MPEADAKTQELQRGCPSARQGFFLKGSAAYDWGMKNRLARIFRPGRDGR